MALNLNTNELKIVSCANNFVSSIIVDDNPVVYPQLDSPISNEYSVSGVNVTGNNTFNIPRNTSGVLTEKNIFTSFKFSFRFNTVDNGATANRFNDLTIQLINSLTNSVVETIRFSRSFAVWNINCAVMTMTGLTNFTLGDKTKGFNYGSDVHPDSHSDITVTYDKSSKKLSMKVNNSRAIDGTYDLGSYNYANGALYIKIDWRSQGDFLKNNLDGWLITDAVIGYKQR